MSEDLHPYPAGKTCQVCRRAYPTREDWERLTFVGVHHFDDETFEYRNCPCGGTMAISLTGIQRGPVKPRIP